MLLTFQNYIAVIASPLGDPSTNSSVAEKSCQLLALPFAIHGEIVLNYSVSTAKLERFSNNSQCYTRLAARAESRNLSKRYLRHKLIMFVLKF